jgi:4-amino-4-deoxy-L-arabinose transferase-like glycosyltransferase
MQKSLLALLLAVTGLLMSFAFSLAHLDELAGNRSLSALTPYMIFVAEKGRYLATHAHDLLMWAAGIAISTVLIFAALSAEHSYRLFFIAVAAALLTQLLLVDESYRLWLISSGGIALNGDVSRQAALYLGLGGYTLVFIIVLLAYRGAAAPDFEEVRQRQTCFGLVEFCWLFLIVIIGTVFRTYALNHHLNTFEGELALYSAGATSPSGIIYANRGYAGPWAPLGILYYLPIYLTTSILGTNLLALRLSSALVGISTIPLVYLLANKIAGRSAAIFASALFSLDCLHIGWSRTDVHPHGVTTWPTLLMCFFLLRAAETKKLSWAIGVAAMMGLSWHQYPSGQSAVAIPLIAVALSFVFNRGTLPITFGQLCFIGIGVVLWIIGLPLSYYPVDGQIKFLNPFTLTGPRALWSSDGTIASAWGMALFVVLKALQHLWDFIQGIFFRVPYLFHQEWLPHNQPLLPRSVPWFVASLCVVSGTIVIRHIKRFESAVLCGWLIAAVLPGILSEHAYPKRMSTVFPLLDILAGIAIGFIFANLRHSRLAFSHLIARALVIVTLVLLTAYSCFLWFSGDNFKYAPAPESSMARQLEQAISADTVVVAGLGGGYEPGKFLYLILDHLTSPLNRPNLYLPISNSFLRQFLTKPEISTKQLGTSLPYTWTKLDKQLEETLAVQQWKYLTVFILDTMHNASQNEESLTLASTMCAAPVIKRVSSSANTREWKMLSITSFTCPIPELKQPLVISRPPTAH